jgi:hypothetical protein
MAAPVNIFRTFAIGAFENTPSWTRLSRILRGNGGCFGIHGPRGSGKSWLMLRAVALADSNNGLGLWFPSPSEYDAISFLSALSDNLANLIERRLRESRRNQALLRSLRISILVVLLALVALPVLTGSVYAIMYPDQVAIFWARSPIVNWLAYLAFFCLLLTVLMEVFRRFSPSGRLLHEAVALRQRVRFATNQSQAEEYGLSSGRSIAGALKRTRNLELAERPITLASLVFDFRAFAALAADRFPGGLVIAIDELDKMERPEAVRTLLRDIKGIFEVERVYFLVSVSEEAAAALQLGAVQSNGRNEFNSSFYTVIELPPLSPPEIGAFVVSRGLTVPDVCTEASLCILSGGNRRDIVRLADQMINEPESELAASEQLILSVMREETSALLRDIVRLRSGPADSMITDLAKSGAWQALSGASFACIDAFIELACRVLEQYWEPDWANDAWRTLVQEQWRRLLVRLHVAALTLGRPAPTVNTRDPIYDAETHRLQAIVVMAARDAGVARLMLLERVSAENRLAGCEVVK